MVTSRDHKKPVNPEDDRIVLPEAPPDVRERLDLGAAVAWREPVKIRTYETHEPSRYPMYLDHRVYQGSSGRVYPIPFTEGVADESTMRDWDVIHLENRYLRLALLPALGGRIHIGYDKTTDYDFFYRNNVIKPALVGLAGPWISGGVEFNWPQHHRPATYLPVMTSIDSDPDGTVTVWCADHEPFARMSAQHGVRLRPDSTVVELVVRLHNRTKDRQTFLWWANVAAGVHDDYQSFFPEDVRYVADHARRALSAFPRADRPYYGVDYPLRGIREHGADRIDWFRNIPAPTSYMVVDSQQDFFGGYDHAAGAGFVHWAERRVSPGKKQWTWGNSAFGRAWDAQLTDSDGPYVELMAGVYTDNQPDFTWLLPGETKVFSQYWFPLPGIGVVHQATPDAAMNVEREDRITVRVAATSPQSSARLAIMCDDRVVAQRIVDMVPGRPVALSADLGDRSGIRIELRDNAGRSLVEWSPTITAAEEPWVAEEPAQPEDIESLEELYLTGIHLAQYRHPTRSPLPYWEAALARDPGDVRTNLAIAERDLLAGCYARAEDRIRLALSRLTRRNANPLDAEAYYLLGLAAQRQGHAVEAERAFGKAGWDGAWAAAAGFSLAQSLAARHANRAALRVLDTLDGVVGHDTRRIALRAIVLRRCDGRQEAQRLLDSARKDDPMDSGLRVLAGERLDDAGVLVDVAIDLRDAGELDDALDLLARAAGLPIARSGNVRPIAYYLSAAIHDLRGEGDAAAVLREQARTCDQKWAFPFGLDALDALQAALAQEPDDAVAHSLIGALLYAHGRRDSASRHWERAVALGSDDPVLLRNAALAAFNIEHDDAAAWERYERAVAAAPRDARLRYEQDQLAIQLGHDAAARLERLRPIEDVVFSRDDLTVEYAALLVNTGESADAVRAYEILTTRSFRPWEGGEGRVLAVWDATRSALGMPRADPPPTLGEARPEYTPPVARHEDGLVDYFATSLPELMLFTRDPVRR